MKKGFTLIELIITMVLIGIMAFLGVDILSKVMEGYVSTQIKTLLFNEAQYGIERMKIEIRNSIPNTIRVLENGVVSMNGYGNGVEFGSFNAAGYYYPLQNSDNITCSELGSVGKGSLVSIYNTKPFLFYSGVRVYKVIDIYKEKDGTVCKLNRNIVKDSPYNRVFEVNDVVLFYLKGNKVYRKSVPFNDADNTTFDGGEVMMNYVKDIKFTYEHGFTYRQAILRIDVIMSKGDISLSYSGEVHIRNVP